MSKWEKSFILRLGGLAAAASVGGLGAGAPGIIIASFAFFAGTNLGAIADRIEERKE